MKLLILTQKVDKSDPILGFFHSWIEAFALKSEKVTVVCLYKGSHSLPGNVNVFSLGKEKGVGRWGYAKNFYKYIWKERKNYDQVFVHMNQEYVILGGLQWKIWGKKVYLWRNHAKGNLITNIAGLVSNKVFYTSPQAFVAKLENSVQMPVGVDLEKFKNSSEKYGDFLMLGRIAPVKRVEEVIEAFKTMKERGIIFSLKIVGSALPEHCNYQKLLMEKIEKYGLSNISMNPEISPSEVPEVLSKYKYFINITPAGSLDKTIFEALAAGMKVLVANPYFKEKLPEEWVIEDSSNSEIFGLKIEKFINSTSEADLSWLPEHGLKSLMEKLKEELS